MAVAEVDENSLEYTPTWVVALVCFSILFISIAVDRFIHCAGQRLKDREWWPLVGGSRKMKDELMLLGLISLLLTVFQTGIGKICISERLDNILLPCKKPNSSSAVANFNTSSFASGATRGRRLHSVASHTTDYCSKKGKVALLSVEALHQLDIFIFVLATFHVVLCVLKVLSMIIQWRRLEIYDRGIRSKQREREGNVVEFILLKQCAKREEKMSDLALLKILVQSPKEFPNLIELVSTLQKSFTSLTEREYIALRANFIEARHPKNPEKDFQKYITRTLQKDFEKMMAIRWYSWLFPVIYLLVNVAGWNAHFWISFIPFTLTIIIGIKLERMLMQLAKEVAKKHKQDKDECSENSEGDLAFEFSEDDFWFAGPKLVGDLLHFLLFVNSLELAFFFFIMFQYGFHSCIMGKVGFVVPRIVMGVIIQTLCSTRILPLHAIIQSQMHWRKKQSDKKNKIRKIKRHLEKDLSDEEEEVEILNSILVMIRKEPNSPEESTNIELARTDSREGSVRSNVSDS